MTDRRQAVAAAAVQPIRLLAIEARASVARLCAAIRAFGEQVDRDALPEATSFAVHVVDGLTRITEDEIHGRIKALEDFTEELVALPVAIAEHAEGRTRRAARGKSGDDEKTRGDRAALDTTNATPRNGACAGSK
jgi:hypothetical protein